MSSTGYNGTIAGFPNCIDDGCPRCADPNVQSGTHLDRCICVHAEQNALLAAARFGVSIEGAACWVTNEPCLDCTKQLVQSGLSEVHYWQPYALQGESHELRTAMREHAKKDSALTFVLCTPSTRVLDLDRRDALIKERLAAAGRR